MPRNRNYTKNIRQKANNVTVNIHPGAITPAMETAWHRFFTNLLRLCQRELSESETEHKES